MQEKKETSKRQLDHLSSAREKAKDWHGSPDGIAWHKEHAKKSLLRKPLEKRICDGCGVEFKPNTHRQVNCTIKCSKKYSARVRRFRFSCGI